MIDILLLFYFLFPQLIHSHKCSHPLRSPLLILALSSLVTALLLLAARRLGLSQLIYALLQQLKVLGGVGGARRGLARLRVIVIVIGAGNFLVLFVIDVVSIALLGEETADGEAVDEEGEADDGGVGDGWAVEFVGLFFGQLVCWCFSVVFVGRNNGGELTSSRYSAVLPSSSSCSR